MDRFGVCIVVWGVLLGPLWSQSIDLGSLVRDGDRVGGLTLDSRPSLPVVNLEDLPELSCISESLWAKYILF